MARIRSWARGSCAASDETHAYAVPPWADIHAIPRLNSDLKGEGSAFGLDDMAGNVWEWCGPRQAETNSRAASSVLLRGGGSWEADASYARSTIRNVSAYFDTRAHFIGFRVVRMGGVRTP